MTPAERRELAANRHRVLLSLGWRQESNAIEHLISGETHHWYDGEIEGREHSAWIGCSSGIVRLHAGEDLEFDAFCRIVVNGWPVAKVATAARGFDFGDD